MTEEQIKKEKKRLTNARYYRKRKSGDSAEVVTLPTSMAKQKIKAKEKAKSTATRTSITKAELQATITQLQNEIINLKSISESESEILNTKILNLDSEIKILKSEKSKSESKANDLNNSVLSMESKIQKYQSENSDLQKKSTESKSLLSHLNKEIDDLKIKISQSESEADDLNNSVSSLKSEIQIFQSVKMKAESKSELRKKRFSQITFSAMTIFVGLCIFWTINLSSTFHEHENIQFAVMVSTLVELGLITSTIFARRSRTFLALSILIFSYLCWSMTFEIFEELNKGISSNAANQSKSEEITSFIISETNNLSEENEELEYIQGKILSKKTDIRSNKTKRDKFKPGTYKYNILRNEIIADEERLDNFYAEEIAQKQIISKIKSSIKKLNESQSSQNATIKTADSNFMILLHHSGLIALRIIIIFLSVSLSHVLFSRFRLKYQN